MIDLSTIEARKQLASKYATKYQIDSALICAVVEQESGWSQYACRFEPGFYTRYIIPLLNSGKITNLTEANLRSTSIGLMQTMGEVVREFGYIGPLLALTDPDTSLDWGCKKLQACLRAADGNFDIALQHWNGGGAPDYASEVLARMSKYRPSN